jgi:hypothetical protein
MPKRTLGQKRVQKLVAKKVAALDKFHRMDIDSRNSFGCFVVSANRPYIAPTIGKVAIP